VIPECCSIGIPAARQGTHRLWARHQAAGQLPNVLINGRPAVVTGQHRLARRRGWWGGSGNILWWRVSFWQRRAQRSNCTHTHGPWRRPAAVSLNRRTEPLEYEEEEEETEPPLEQRNSPPCAWAMFFRRHRNNLANAALTEQCRARICKTSTPRPYRRFTRLCEPGNTRDTKW